MSIRKKIIFILALSFLCFKIYALNLGTPKVYSSLYEPLDAEIKVSNAIQSVKAYTATEKDFKAYGIEFVDDVVGLKYKTINKRDGTYIKIYSYYPMVNNTLDFLVNFDFMDKEYLKPISIFLSPAIDKVNSLPLTEKEINEVLASNKLNYGYGFINTNIGDISKNKGYLSEKNNSIVTKDDEVIITKEIKTENSSNESIIDNLDMHTAMLNATVAKKIDYKKDRDLQEGNKFEQGEFLPVNNHELQLSVDKKQKETKLTNDFEGYLKYVIYLAVCIGILAFVYRYILFATKLVIFAVAKGFFALLNFINLFSKTIIFSIKNSIAASYNCIKLLFNTYLKVFIKLIDQVVYYFNILVFNKFFTSKESKKSYNNNLAISVNKKEEKSQVKKTNSLHEVIIISESEIIDKEKAKNSVLHDEAEVVEADYFVEVKNVEVKNDKLDLKNKYTEDNEKYFDESYEINKIHNKDFNVSYSNCSNGRQDLDLEDKKINQTTIKDELETFTDVEFAINPDCESDKETLLKYDLAKDYIGIGYNDRAYKLLSDVIILSEGELKQKARKLIEKIHSSS